MVVLYLEHVKDINWPYLQLFFRIFTLSHGPVQKEPVVRGYMQVARHSFPGEALLAHFLPKNGTIALIDSQSEQRIICGTPDLVTVIWGGGTTE